MRGYLLRVAIALDVLLMTTLFNGKRGETMSAACWSLEQHGHFFKFWRKPIDAFFSLLGDRDHCANSWLEENNHGNT